MWRKRLTRWGQKLQGDLGWVLCGGLLMGFTPAPLEAFPLAWIALAPLWWAVVRGTPRQAIFYGLVWGCGYHGLALFWITGIHPMTWMGVPWLASLLIALLCWLFITAWGAALVAGWALGMGWLNRVHPPAKMSQFAPILPYLAPLSRILTGIALWCVLEAIWRSGDLWWSSLAYTQSPHNLFILHLGQLSGSGMVTAAIVLVNGILAEGLLSRRWQALGWALSCCLVLHLVGFTLYSRPLNDQNPLTIGIIQGNVPNEIKLYPAGWQKAIEGYTQGYLDLTRQGVEAVLTPETALPFIWNERFRQTRSFYQAVLNQGVLVWMGGFGQKGDRLTNSLFTLSGTGEVLHRYDKVKLVPLGEYIPFESLLSPFINRLSPLDAHLAFGKPDQIVQTPFGQAIVGICYESAFQDHFRRQTRQGGEFILTASNNAHYSEVMPAQHHAQDVMRAIENDRWAARATNTGYSAWVDPHGRTLWISGINRYETYIGTLYRRQTQTLYVRWGDWLTPLLFVVMVGVQGGRWFNQSL
ncbi:apolipoprotein N-acyltransferase [Spirulina subsalsa FACHB-351]|uniref:Apolipoprotein N-acyltransferase n=1 Tax=Spirulina subsalsa FACHB-351 TaxID=234711 RepID=A0ABT3L4D7_9CYAN|nr:apolipoprotein N-acyltransferase [Spirulina subsalsa]MCW6036057.1 apolipoprotein N-acyltransferase [Spirulina subsalsa FACHB-351]